MKYFLWLVLLFSTIGATMAQDKIPVSGKITSKTDAQPIPGVTVLEKGTTNGTTTNEKGEYTLRVSPGATFLFSFIGMVSQEAALGNSSVLDMILEEDLKKLDEVVVTGYKAERKADLTGAVSVVKLSDIKDIPTADPIKNLQGRVAGMQVTTSGSPGATASVRIRGQGTLNNNDPLYVIDGIPTKEGLQSINQNDIESIQVLKDASAASIYGSRAGNGVIIVTTKRAKAGFSRIDFSSFWSFQRYQSKLKVLNTDQRARVYWQAAVNDGVTPSSPLYQFNSHLDAQGKPVLDGVSYPEFIDAAQTMRPANTRWFDEISQTGLMQSYNLNFSNGGEKGTMLFSLNYLDHDGIIKETNLNRLTLRLNSDYNFLQGKLKVGENLTFAKTRQTLLPEGEIMNMALIQQSIVPVRTLTGGWGGPVASMSDRQNPVRLIADNQQNKSYAGRIFGNVYADLEILPKLQLRTSIGVDYTLGSQRVLYKAYTSGFLSDPMNRATNTENFYGNWIWQNTLTYSLERNKHRLDFLAGTERIRYNNQSFWASRQGFALQTPEYMYLDAGSANKDNGGSAFGYGLMSFFGKVNYALADRYLASVTVRRDGSSRFGSDQRYGTFPAFSLGWRLSEENFLKDHVTAISDLKLRFGWGVTGNQDFANNAIYRLYESNYGIDPTWDFDIGTAYDITGANTGSLPSGYRLIQQGNDKLKWESTTQTNYGIDFSLFEYKLTGSVDYFVKKTKDILVSPPYLGVVGEGGNQWVNGASMENSGIELQLGYQGKIANKVNFNLSGNISSYQNKVTYLPREVVNSYGGNGRDVTILGRSINSIYGYVADGIFQTQEQVDSYATQIGKGVGRIRYKDLNGDGVVDDRDRTWIGNSNPKFMYGLNADFSFKGIDVVLFFQGLQRADVYNDNKLLTDFASLASGVNWGERTLDAWSPTNPTSTIPALTLTDKNNEQRRSSYFVEQGSYLKLRNVQVGYTIPATLLKRYRMQQARLYVQAQNVLTLRKKTGNSAYTGVDPETPNATYPIPAVYTLGLNLSF